MSAKEEECILNYEGFGSVCVRSLENTAGPIEALAFMDFHMEK